MKKIFFILAFLFGHLHALDIQSTLNVYHEIFSGLLPKSKIKVYTLNRELIDVFEHSKIITLTKKASRSDIVIISTEMEYQKIDLELKRVLEKKPILFTTSYHLLREYENIIGAFYWRKGRTQLLFIQKRLEKSHIDLPYKYQKFMVDEL